MNKKNNRNQTSLPITGLDTSTPDNFVADGKQSTLHNARFSGSAWRNVRPFAFKDIAVPSELSGIEIIYHHPTTGENTYIGIRQSRYGNYDLYLVEVNKTNMVGTHFATVPDKNIKTSHFGNILIIIDLSNQIVYHYIFSNNSYKKVIIPRYPIIKVDTDLHSSSTTVKNHTKISGNHSSSSDNGNPLFFDKQSGLFSFPQVNETTPDYFWGEICFFACYKMYDGSIVSPSALQIVASEPFECSSEARTFQLFDRVSYNIKLASFYCTEGGKQIFTKAIPGVGETKDGIGSSISVVNMCISPYVTIKIDTGNMDENLISSIDIYSTRINNLWDAAKLMTLNTGYYRGNGIFQKVDTFEYKKYRADNNLPEQPFYLAKSIPLNEFKDGAYSFYITGTILKDIEMKSQYDPINAHSLYYSLVKNYNSRIHIGGELKTYFFLGYGDAFFDRQESTEGSSMTTEIQINSNTYFVNDVTISGLRDSFINNKILSYPDYRAKKIYDVLKEKAIDYIYLKPAITNNFAYAIYGNDQESVDLETQDDRGNTIVRHENLFYVKYSAKFSQAMIEMDSPIVIEPRGSITEKNKFLVSEPNNPFSFPLANSYAIGTDSNRILAINSAAIEMSDAKFGEFPLYVFTEEGIFALQSGSGEVLYSAVIPLNYDRIINPETLAVNYNVIYITERGIHAMFSNESSLISGPINDNNNHPLLDFLRTAHLCYQHINNEVVVYNTDEKSNRAFVFSLDNKTWSTRQFVGNKINNDDIIFPRTDNRIRIQRLNEEIAPSAHPDGSVLVKFVSRPIKLGSMEFKRLETFIARLVASGSYSTTITLEGSVDLKTWITLREVTASADRDISVRRTPSSFRYLRATLSVVVPEDFELSGYDLEYYLRFLHRLR